MKKILALLDKIEENFCAINLLIMLCVLTLQVVQRYAFNASNTWSEELSRYLFIWLLYIGMSYTFKERAHIQLEIAMKLWPKKIHWIIRKIGYMIVVGFSAVVVVVSTQYVANYAKQGQVSLSLGLPMWIVYLSIPLGFAFLGIRNLIAIFRKEAEGDPNEEYLDKQMSDSGKEEM